MDEAIAQLRNDYAQRPLLQEDVGADPVAAARAWLEDAVRAQVKDPNAMTLATVDEDGFPDARIVLLKGIEADKFLFFTNYQSAKGRHLAAHPHAALVFFWPELERQVKVRGRVERLLRSSSEAYFQSRPRGSQVGAWASAQSRPLADRTILEAEVKAIEARFEGHETLPLPEHWGGFALNPDCIELWQGRPSRLHDRLQAQRHQGGWQWRRLFP